MVSLAQGATVGRYRLDRFLGQGGMGQVWAATHTATNQPAALKILLRSACMEPEVRRRFLREARAAGAVAHRNVVKIYDFFELEDGTPVMAMELLEGETLTERLQRDRTLTLETAASLLLPVISAVGKAHATGVVHRDLKPDNVFLQKRGASVEPRVLDFGIAKLLDGTIDETTGASSLTRSGTMLGTPSYMAPEQTLCEYEIDHRADIWALGAVLYEALAGTRPVDWDNVGQLVRNFMTHKITPLEALRPELPADVTSLVGRMLARDRNARPHLDEVFRVLSSHTHVVAEPFAAPLRGAPEPDPPSPPVMGGGGTLASALDPAPPARSPSGSVGVGGVDSTGPHEIPRPAASRARASIAFAAFALAVITLAAALLRRETTPATSPAAAAPRVAHVPVPASEPAAAPTVAPLSSAGPAPTPRPGAVDSTPAPPAPARSARPKAKGAPAPRTPAFNEDGLIDAVPF